MQLGQLTEEESSIFGISWYSIRPYEYSDDVHTILTYEFDLDMSVINRDTYTSLNLLGDIGGLAEGVYIIFGFIVVLFNYNTFEDYLVRQLYRRETQKDKISRKSGLNSAAETLKLQNSEGRRLKDHQVNCLVRRLRDMGL